MIDKRYFIRNTFVIKHIKNTTYYWFKVNSPKAILSKQAPTCTPTHLLIY